MPELPEVETVVRGLKQTIIGKTVESVKILDEKPLINSKVPEFSRFIEGRRFTDVLRFGKYIHFLLDNGSSLVAHLRMTGKYIYQDVLLGTEAGPRTEAGPPTLPENSAHLRIIFYFTDGSKLFYKDMRRFGTIKIYRDGAVIEEKARTGPDPFEKIVTPAWLLEKLKKRKQAIKPVLLDQKLLSGLGNIYVCEALFKAQVNPFLPADRLDENMAEKLLAEIRNVLRLAIKKNGTTISDFRSIDEKSGEFQAMLQVYGKEGEICRKCGSVTISRRKQEQRSTYYCSYCQGVD